MLFCPGKARSDSLTQPFSMQFNSGPIAPSDPTRPLIKHLISTLLVILAVGWCGSGSRARAIEPTSSVALEPPVQAASEEGLQTLAAMRLAEGWKRELFAAEPLVANIVAFDVDPQGRLYVAESFRQDRGVTDNRGHDETWLLADLAAQTVQDRIDYHKRLLGDKAASYTQHDDRIRRLRDIDGDGRADESIVFAKGFNRLEEGTGAGLLVRGNEVFFTCIPKLWKLVDSNADGQADQRTVLSDGYGVRVAFRGHDLHGPIIGPDGRLYFSLGDRGHNVTTADGRVLADPASGSVFRCELDGSGLEVIASGLRNPQELAFNDYGDLFTGDNNSDSGDKARIVQIVKGGDSGWRMYYQYAPDRGPFNREKIWHPYDPQANPEQPAYIVPPIANLTDGPSGLAFDPGTGVDDSLRGAFLLCDFRGGAGNSGIRSFRLDVDGAFYKLAGSQDPIWNVLATDVAFGPDGALWISDWVEGWNGEGKGRIYRVTGPNFNAAQAAEVAAILAGDWSQVDADQLQAWLAHADRRVRNESQWELARRGDAERLLKVAANSSAGRLARLHAIWGIDQILRLSPDKQARAATLGPPLIARLSDSDEFVRAAAAAAVGERNLAQGREQLVALLADPSSRVRFHAAMGLAAGLAKGTGAVSAVVAMLVDNADRDPMLRHAGIMALAGSGDVARLAALKKHERASVRRAAVVALRRLKAAEVVDFLADSDIQVVVEAARAIHDVPLAVGLEPLAKLIQKPSENDALMRRVLNANYRLGTADAAMALAEYATRAGAPTALRIEALQMLKNWGQPDPRDRVLTDYRPLPERPAAVAKAALAKTLPMLLRNGDEARDLAVSIAASYGIADVIPVLQRRVADQSLRPETRADALESLAAIAPERAAEVAATLLDSHQAKLRITALETIAKITPEASVELLKKGTASDVTAQRQSAWDMLARIDSPHAREAIAAGVREYLAGKVPADTALNLIEAAKNKLDPELAQQLQQHQEQLEQTDPLGRWHLSLEGGDRAAGAEIYTRTQLSCVRCHKVGGTGGEVGPDLSTVGKQRDRRYLLEAICLPDATIAEGFQTVVIADDLGQVFTGIVKQEDDESVELIQADGQLQRIPQDSITARKRGKSAMPEELATYMSARELRDLVAYLASLRGEAE